MGGKAFRGVQWRCHPFGGRQVAHSRIRTTWHQLALIDMVSTYTVTLFDAVERSDAEGDRISATKMRTVDGSEVHDGITGKATSGTYLGAGRSGSTMLSEGEMVWKEQTAHSSVRSFSFRPFNLNVPYPTSSFIMSFNMRSALEHSSFISHNCATQRFHLIGKQAISNHLHTFTAAMFVETR